MRQFLLASAILLAVPLVAGKAQAVPMLGLTVESGGASNFQSATLDAAGGAKDFGQVTVGNFTAYNIGAELLSPSHINLTTLDFSSDTGGTLTITLTGTDFAPPKGATNWLTQLYGYSFNFPGFASPDITVTSYLDNSNALQNPGCAMGGCTLLSGVNLNDMATATAKHDGLFALTEVITITASGPGSFGLSAGVTDVPEPMSLALLGTGLVGLGSIRRRASRQAV